MKSNVIKSRRVVQRRGPRALLWAGLAALALFASCGGGGTVANNFTATRVISFGDENSVINDDGSKYTVNALLPAGSGITSTSGFDCSSNPIWIQALAGLYRLVFPQCPGQSLVVTDPQSRIYAANGAVVADLGPQIDRRLNDGGFTSTDLVTVLVGANDVIAQFQLYPSVGEDQLLASLDQAGKLLAAQVNRLADTGAKVLVSTIPDMGLTPFAGDRSVGSTNGNPALLSRLSARFNDAMLADLRNDGTQIGLVQLDEYLQVSDKAAQFATGSFGNTTTAECAVTILKCTVNTLIPDASTTTFLWADDRHLTPLGQQSLGSLATTRAVNNPF